jgi:hypothetical protein
MPEAAGFSNPTGRATSLTMDKAGFPKAGSPLFRLARRTAFFTLAAWVLALAGGSLAIPCLAAGKAPAFLQTELMPVADPVLRGELAAVSTDFAGAVTDKTLARFGRKHARRRTDLLAAPPQEYRDHIRADALARLLGAGMDPALGQYFVYADRNPATQMLFLAYYDATHRRVILLGTDFISSGKLRPGDDSFLTPLGAFEHLPDNWGYRAEGTKNAKGWRGLGARGSRVWDFGYQQAPRQFRQGVYDSQMRLLMHATDPDNGEPRLGGPDSKGCVRVSAAANAFLDRRAILDRHYEKIAAAEKDHDMWLLRTDRSPVAHPGSFLVVGDSAILSAARAEPQTAPTPQ